MGRFLLISHKLLLNIPFLDIFSGLVDSFQKATNSGDYDPNKLKDAAKALQQIQPYLHFDNAINQILSYFKWGLIKFVYGIANATSELATQSLNFSSLLKSSNLDPFVKNGIMLLVTGLMIVTLIIAAIKYGTNYHAPQLKNVFFQLLISSFLIFNIQPMMQTLVDFSTGAYKGFTQVNTNKGTGTSDLPYNLVKNNSNDLFVLVSNNFKGLKKDKNGNVVQQKAVHYGSFNMSQNDFNKASSGNLSVVITPDVAKEMASKKNEQEWAWNPDNLRYMLEPSGTNNDQQGYGSFIATKINENSLPFFKIFNGGYERYSVNFLPVFVGLIAIAIAFLLVAWVVIKSFLELAIMQPIGIFTFATDLETGERTKAVVEDILQSATVIAFQGLELAFYEIVIIWISNTPKINNNPYLFCVAMIASTAFLFKGSTKVAKFFGVDTGLQDGWQRMIGTAAAGKYLLSGTKNVAKAATSATHKAKTGMQEVNAGVAGFKAGFDEVSNDSTSNSGTLKGITNGVTRGLNQARALGSIKDEFMDAGGSKHQFNKALRTTNMKEMASNMGKRMTDATGGLTDTQYNSFQTPEQLTDDNGNIEPGAYNNYALRKEEELRKKKATTNPNVSEPTSENGERVASNSVEPSVNSSSTSTSSESTEPTDTVVNNKQGSPAGRNGRNLNQILGEPGEQINKDNDLYKEGEVNSVKIHHQPNRIQVEDQSNQQDELTSVSDNINKQHESNISHQEATRSHTKNTSKISDMSTKKEDD